MEIKRKSSNPKRFENKASEAYFEPDTVTIGDGNLRSVEHCIVACKWRSFLSCGHVTATKCAVTSRLDG